MQLDGLRAELRQRVRITARLSANEGQALLRRTSPRDTGYMAQQSTVRDHPDALGATIEAKIDTDYAQYVKDGTRPHVISAVNAQALRFNWRGETVFFKRVHHPGTQPNSWVDDWTRDMSGIIRQQWEAVNR